MAKQYFKLEIPTVFPNTTPEQNATLVYEMIADWNGYEKTVVNTVEHTGTLAEFETAMNTNEVVQISHDEDTNIVVWTIDEEIDNPTSKEQHGKNVLVRPMLEIFKKSLITMNTKQLEEAIKQTKEQQKATIKAVEQAVEQAIIGIVPQ